MAAPRTMPLLSALCLALLARSCDALPRISVDPATGHFVDDVGRVRLFRGVNSVNKSEPWFTEIHLRPELQRHFADNGFNVIRLGSMWTGFQPEEQAAFNMEYVDVMKRYVSEFEALGMWTLLDMHQDVLWRAGPNDDRGTYWGVPPWIKHSLDQTEHELYPWPLESVGYWFCGYVSEEISLGFQRIYNDEVGTAAAWADFWRFVAQTFNGNSAVIGYELMNEPWNGDVFRDASLILPGVAGRKNLSPLYDRASNSIREVDDQTIVFWEPVTWGTVFPFNNAALDILLEEVLSQLTILDLQPAVEALCGPFQQNATSAFNFIELALGAAKALINLEHVLAESSPHQLNRPPAFGPGLSHVPGGDEYLNRTAMSWHYYCWFIVPSQGEYDPEKKRLCQEVMGPAVFESVDLRRRELGPGVSGTMLTEFGLCNVNMSRPDSQDTIECNYVVSNMESRFESWILWETADSGHFWNLEGELLPERVALYSRPFPAAIAGKPLSLAFDIYSKEFSFEFYPTLPEHTTEIFVPQLHYPDGQYIVETSAELTWEVAGDRPDYIYVNAAEDADPDVAVFVRISPISKVSI